MKRYGGFLSSVRLPFAFTAITMILASSFALGEPIRYTGFTVMDGQLGTWKFHNARVILTFDSDTKYVETLGTACIGVNAAFNSTGVARVTIADHEKIVTAKFDPNQIFVSFDQDNGGIGFGSFAPGPPFVAASCSNPGSLIPSYPLGLHHGTMDYAQNNDAYASANQEAFPDNLQGTVGFSGTGYTCVGVPRKNCPDATAPLATDHGNLYFSQPYQGYGGQGYLVSLNGALFFQETGESGIPLPASVLAPSGNTAKRSITYHMLLVSDVSLDGELYQNASIHLSFQSRVSRVSELADAGPNGAINTEGAARVDIKAGTRTISASFDPGQIYVYFDPATKSAGFGSFSGGRAYPAILGPTYAHGDPDLLAAVADILTGGTTYYTSPTTDLAHVTDLKHETMLSDYVSSCTDYDFSALVGVCYNLPSSRKLTTNRGDFYLYQPYNVSSNTDPTPQIRSSDNWGIFWTTLDGND